MFKNRFEPMLDEDDGLTTVANGADSPTADDLKDSNDGIQGLNDDLGGETDEPKTDKLQNEPDEPQDITQTQAFSKRLNEARAKDLQRISELEEIAKQKETFDNQFSRLKQALGSYGYDGDMETIADMLEAEQRNITPEEIKAEREAQSELINKAIENHPLIQEARRIQERQRIDMANMQIEKDLGEIRQIDPQITSIEDLAKLPNADMILALVKNGATYSQAYKRVHDLSHTAPKPIDTKAHLQGIGGSGSGSSELVDIPADEISTWKSAFPDISMKELKQKYNNSLNR